jgi:hypothetical protein
MLKSRSLANHAAPILCGGDIGLPGAQAGTPVYLSGGGVDQHVPPSRTRETRRVLGERGALVETRLFADRRHMASKEEVASQRRRIRALVETSGGAVRRATGRDWKPGGLRRRSMTDAPPTGGA